MTGRPRERLRWTWLHTAAVAWTCGGLLLAYASPWIRDLDILLGIAILGGYVLAGAAVVFAALRAGARRGWTRARITAAGAVLVGAVVVGELAPRLQAAGDAHRFRRHFQRMAPAYERIVAELATQPRVPRRGTSGGVAFLADTGPPLRVAFPLPRGRPDDWQAVVHDPTGAVRAARGWRGGVEGRFSAPAQVVALFGGPLLSCEPVRGPFYRCWFTERRSSASTKEDTHPAASIPPAGSSAG